MDYAPSLRAMQVADTIQNSAGVGNPRRSARRARTYWSKVVDFEVEHLQGGLAVLARTGLANEG